jgi:hypothetical protein
MYEIKEIKSFEFNQFFQCYLIFYMVIYVVTSDM